MYILTKFRNYNMNYIRINVFSLYKGEDTSAKRR